MKSQKVSRSGKAILTGSQMVLENSWVRRILEKKNGVWRTRSFSRADGSDEVQVDSDEFTVLLMEGRRLTIEDYRAQGDPVSRQQGKSTVVEITYVPRGQAQPGAPRSIRVQYVLGKEPCLRKALVLTMEQGGAVDRLEVEHFRTELVCDRGGIGAPVFIGSSWFVGLEYPGSYAEHCDGLVTLAHYPGFAKQQAGEEPGPWVVQSKTAVAGVGNKGVLLELAFLDYLETIRQPCPTQITIRNKFQGAGITTSPIEGFLRLFDSFKKNLDPYGVKLDSLQLDQMGFAPESVSRPRRDLFPGGYGPLSAALKARGSCLSLWLALNGTGNLLGVDDKEDVAKAEWMAKQGYQRANGPFQDFYGYYCLANPNFNAATRETLKETIREGDISYFKHDFVQMQCSAEGHAHLPTARHGFEANLDATLALLDDERRWKPDILRAPTSYVWLSPWWLMHANYIWYGASDSGGVSSWPQLSPSEWEMTYHDGHLYKVQNQWRHPVPVSAMVTQAFLRNYKRDADNPESLREWSDFTMMACGRGLCLLEFYFEPDLSPAFWEVLGKSLRWWRENQDTLRNTRMFGGNPRQGKLFGYAHWQGERGILCLRNPDIGEQAIRVPFDEQVFYRGKVGGPFRGRVIYPYGEDLPTQFHSGDPLLLSVPGYTVMLIELQPGQASQLSPAKASGLIEAHGSVVPGERDGTKAPDFYKDPSLSLTAQVTVQVPDEEMARCDLFFIARSNGALPEFPVLTVNGRPARVRTASGAGDKPVQMLFARDTDTVYWSIRSVDLRAFRGQAVELLAKSAKNPVPFILEVWVVADRPVAAAAAAGRSSPPGFWQNYRRQTTRLLSYSLSLVPLHH
jgi:hypothetical protein